MRRIAAKHVVMPNGTTFTNHVVEIMDSRLVNHYPLQGEIEMTEWLGGTIVVEADGIHHLTRLSDGTQRKQQL